MTIGPVITTRDLRKSFRPRHAEPVQAVRGVSFDVAAGEIFGLRPPVGKRGQVEQLDQLAGPPLDRGGIAAVQAAWTATRAVSAGAWTSRWASSTSRACCSSTSRAPGLIPRTGPICGSTSSGCASGARPCF